jgi:hypothetical protein
VRHRWKLRRSAPCRPREMGNDNGQCIPKMTEANKECIAGRVVGRGGGGGRRQGHFPVVTIPSYGGGCCPALSVCPSRLDGKAEHAQSTECGVKMAVATLNVTVDSQTRKALKDEFGKDCAEEAGPELEFLTHPRPFCRKMTVQEFA